MTCTISQMTMYAHFRRKHRRANQVEVQAGARRDVPQLGNQVEVQEGMFPSSENKPNNQSHPSRCYQNTLPNLRSWIVSGTGSDALGVAALGVLPFLAAVLMLGTARFRLSADALLAERRVQLPAEDTAQR